MNPYWSYLLTAVGVFGLWLAGRKDRRGWMVGVGAQTLWIAYATATQQWGFYISAIAYGWVYIKNARAWKKPEPFVHSQISIGQVTGYIEDTTHIEVIGTLYYPGISKEDLFTHRPDLISVITEEMRQKGNAASSNYDYPAAILKHSIDFLKEHDPAALDALDDLGKEE